MHPDMGDGIFCGVVIDSRKPKFVREKPKLDSYVVAITNEEYPKMPNDVSHITCNATVQCDISDLSVDTYKYTLHDETIELLSNAIRDSEAMRLKFLVQI